MRVFPLLSSVEDCLHSILSPWVNPFDGDGDPENWSLR